MPNKYNRRYKTYDPDGTGGGPPTQRICKQVKCEDKDSNTNPTPPAPNP